MNNEWSVPMHTNTYSKLALRTEANQEHILARLAILGPQAMRLDNAARGLAGDAGEVSSAVMRYIEYGKPLDRTNLLEEVGDCLWRLNQVCAAAGFTLEDAMVANIAKLSARYPDKYSDELAQNRDVSAERAAIEHVNKVESDVLAKDSHAYDHQKTEVVDNTSEMEHGLSLKPDPCPGSGPVITREEFDSKQLKVPSRVGFLAGIKCQVCGAPATRQIHNDDGTVFGSYCSEACEPDKMRYPTKAR